MSEFEAGNPPPEPTATPHASEGTWQTVPPHAQPGYPPPPPHTQSEYTQTSQPPSGYASPVAGGLSDNTAGALAYVTIIPAIIFLVLAPYNRKPFIRFHAIQELGLFVFMVCLHFLAIIPILGWIAYIVGAIAAVVVWVICIYKASQGSAFKIPVIGDIAAQQSGYVI
jgi:uncharacterized membrane protein